MTGLLWIGLAFCVLAVAGVGLCAVGARPEGRMPYFVDTVTSLTFEFSL